MVRQMDDLVTGDDGGDLYRLDRNQAFLNQGLDEDISKSKEGDEVEELTHGVSLLADESVHITPGFFQVFRGQAKQAACMIYYSRKDAGTPRISPKAGNMVSPRIIHTYIYTWMDGWMNEPFDETIIHWGAKQNCFCVVTSRYHIIIISYPTTPQCRS